MKKLLSLALTLAMLCCMATTAFAANETVSVVGAVTTDNVTGDPVHVDASLNNGVADFDSAGNDYVIDINVSANTTVDRYAVDVEYDNDPLEISGSTMTWDVNTMTYKTTDAGDDGDGNLTKTVTIYNYSNKGVKAYAAVAKVASYEEAPLVATSNYADAEHALDIAAATPGVNGANGTAATGTITVTLDPETTWDAVSAYLAGVGAPDEVTIAQATLTITKA